MIFLDFYAEIAENKIMNGFLKRVLEEMDFLQVSKAELSRAIEVPDPTVRSWFSKDSIPAADTALKIARFLNVSLEYLITGKNPLPKSEKEEKNYDSEFLDLFNSLPECEQIEIKEIVKLKCRKCTVSQTRKQHEKKDLLDFQFD